MGSDFYRIVLPQANGCVVGIRKLFNCIKSHQVRTESMYLRFDNFAISMIILKP